MSPGIPGSRQLRQVQLILNVGALSRDLSQRGFMGSLCITAYTEDARIILLAWLDTGNSLYEIICLNTCRALFGWDEPGFYGVRIAPAPPGSGTDLGREQFEKAIQVDAKGRREVAMRFQTCAEDDAIQRGVTSSLYLLPHITADSRIAVLVGYRTKTLAHQVLRVDACRALFSVSDIGGYDVFVTRETHDPGSPLEQLDHEP